MFPRAKHQEKTWNKNAIKLNKNLDWKRFFIKQRDCYSMCALLCLFIIGAAPIDRYIFNNILQTNTSECALVFEVGVCRQSAYVFNCVLLFVVSVINWLFSVHFCQFHTHSHTIHTSTHVCMPLVLYANAVCYWTTSVLNVCGEFGPFRMYEIWNHHQRRANLERNIFQA